jgi:hypothetical protein
MTRASLTLTQLSPAVGLCFMGPLFGSTFAAVFQAIGVYLISILGLELLLPNREAFRFGARVLKGKITQFDNLCLCKKSLVPVPFEWVMSGRVAPFCDAPALWTLLWRFS